MCGDEPTVSADSLPDYVEFCGVPACDAPLGLERLAPERRVTAGQLAELQDGHAPPLLLDVRPRVEFGICALPNSVNIPFSELTAESTRAEALAQVQHALPDTVDRRVVVVCRRGNDSQLVVQQLLAELAEHPICESLADLVGGLTAWARHDPTFPVY